MTTIGNNLQQVHGRIAAACRAAGRAPQAVGLLAVSKTFGADAVRAAAAEGQLAFGENYVQEAVDKIADLRANPPLGPGGSPVRLCWHCIGPVQSNKTRLVAEHFDWVQSIDRLRIAERLAAQRPAALGALQVCLQVNIDGGSAKSGVAPDQALLLARDLAALPGITLRGLMAIPEPAPDAAAALAVHRQARALFDELAQALGASAARFDTLSIGMSADLEAAVHAGSTLVRVGTAIFGARS